MGLADAINTTAHEHGLSLKLDVDWFFFDIEAPVPTESGALVDPNQPPTIKRLWESDESRKGVPPLWLSWSWKPKITITRKLKVKPSSPAAAAPGGSVAPGASAAPAEADKEKNTIEPIRLGVRVSFSRYQLEQAVFSVGRRDAGVMEATADIFQVGVFAESLYLSELFGKKWPLQFSVNGWKFGLNFIGVAFGLDIGIADYRANLRWQGNRADEAARTNPLLIGPWGSIRSGLALGPCSAFVGWFVKKNYDWSQFTRTDPETDADKTYGQFNIGTSGLEIGATCSLNP